MPPSGLADRVGGHPSAGPVAPAHPLAGPLGRALSRAVPTKPPTAALQPLESTTTPFEYACGWTLVKDLPPVHILWKL